MHNPSGTGRDALSLLARVGRLGSAVLASSVVTMAASVVVARSADVGEWAAVGIGQSIGGLGAIAVALGWTVSGPSLVAVSDPAERRRLAEESIATRLVALMLLVPVAGTAAALMSPTDDLLAAATAMAICFFGLSPRWYSVGLGSSSSVLIYDVVPSVATALMSVLVVGLGGSLFFYPLLLASGYAGGAFVFWVALSRQGPLQPWRQLDLRVAWRRQRTVVVSELLLSGFLPGAVAVASISLSVDETARFASGFRVLQWSLLAVYILTQASQAWAAGAGPSRPDRLRLLMGAHAVLGLGGGLVFAAWGSAVTRLLFGPELQVDDATTAAMGLVFLATSVSTGIGVHVLVTSGLTRHRLAGAVVTLVAGYPAVLVLGDEYGVAGASAGLAVGAIVGCVHQILVARLAVLTKAGSASGG